MATVSLPDRVSFEQLRNQAMDLRRAVRAGAPDALAEVADRYPGGLAVAGPFPLSAAQLVIARRYGRGGRPHPAAHRGPARHRPA